jgi:hypothetical protein
MKIALIFILTAITLSEAYASNDAKKICEMNRNIAAQMAPQLPQKIDAMTSLEGMSAFYINGECTITLNYIIDESMLINQFIEGYVAAGGEKLSRSQALAFIDSDDIRLDIAQTMAGQSTGNMKEIAEIPNVTVKVVYTTDMRSISPFIVEIEP